MLDLIWESIQYYKRSVCSEQQMADDDPKIYLVIGSSASGMFQLVYGSQVRVLRYTTATAKGLGQNNTNSKHIWDMLSTKYAHVDISAVIWLFGNVDTKFSYYYKLCREWQGTLHDKPDPDSVMEGCAISYMSFVKKVHDSFLSKKGTKTIIIGAEPNGAPPALMFDQCVKYFVAQDTEENRARVTDSIAVHHPDRLRKSFNSTLRDQCATNGFHYLDLDDEVLLPYGLDTLASSVVKEDYVDINPSSVHLNWEGMLLLYIKKLRTFDVTIEDTLDLEQTRDAYLKEKQCRKRKPEQVIAERWEKSLKTHIDEKTPL